MKGDLNHSGINDSDALFLAHIGAPPISGGKEVDQDRDSLPRLTTSKSVVEWVGCFDEVLRISFIRHGSVT